MIINLELKEALEVINHIEDALLITTSPKVCEPLRKARTKLVLASEEAHKENDKEEALSRMSESLEKVLSA